MADTASGSDAHSLSTGITTPEPVRSILFLDAFDSFANNVVGLLEQTTKAKVTTIQIDNRGAKRNFRDLVRDFDAVVIGPGPGHPANPRDVGIINELWQLADLDILPVFGICLGFQSLCLNHGASVKKLQNPRHGIICRPVCNNSDIFSDISELEATQYHSLHVDLLYDDELLEEDYWKASSRCPDLVPLAWDMNDIDNGQVLMGVRHATKPFWGVQFHPESICTTEEGAQIVANWWHQALLWLDQHNRDASSESWSKSIINKPLGQSLDDDIGEKKTIEVPFVKNQILSTFLDELRSVTSHEDISLKWRCSPGAEISPIEVIEALGLDRDEFILLDSQGHNMGRYSILGLMPPEQTMIITYNAYDKVIKFGRRNSTMHTFSLDSIESIWPIFQNALDMHKPNNFTQQSQASSLHSTTLQQAFDSDTPDPLPYQSPFWGGFMGYISYEAGLETINVELNSSNATGSPDVNFAFIHRSIVIDHQESKIYCQSLLQDDLSWILRVGQSITDRISSKEVPSCPNTRSSLRTPLNLLNTRLVQPTEPSYKAKVRDCQSFLATGESYELCLTDINEILVPTRNRLDSWQLYKQLRANNASPFGAYMQLSPLTIVGSSPERFLQWTRSGHCQFRPIKGTVKKGPDMTSERANEILNTSKERAENLMIVDLIRHDLCGVVGVANSWVSKLMVVEEYEKVYQLVSVIEGQLPDKPMIGEPRGIDVLKASLPPGSMTGAPKKRSCEILRDLEDRARGIYSGVLGYMDVGGAGDFSVVIRTAIHQTAQATNPRGSNAKGYAAGFEQWTVGAGGAVTIQSSDKGEYEEMKTKASSVLDALLQQEV